MKMTNAEEMLELLLNLFTDKHEVSSVWMKDEEEHSRGFLVYDCEDSVDAFIVIIQEAKIVPT